MLVQNIPNNQIQKLYISLDSNLSSFRKRSISYIITAHSNSVASISICVNGKNGYAVKEMVVIYNTTNLEWEIYSEGKKFTLNSLSEINPIVNTMISKISTTVNKL